MGIDLITAEEAVRLARLNLRDITGVDVRKFGAKGDGVTDDTAAFNAAIATRKNVMVPNPSGTAVYMVQGGGVDPIESYQSLYGVGRPTIKLIGGSNINPMMFRAMFGRHDFSISGLILDGNKANISSITTNDGAINIPRDGYNIWVFDNEIKNTTDVALATADYVAGGTGPYNIRIVNNYIHDVTGIGNGNAVYLGAVKRSWFIGNRVVDSYDDNFALISSYTDANDECVDCIIADNICDTSRIASNIALTGHGHICSGNVCLNNSSTQTNHDIGAIRIRSSASDDQPLKTMPYDITVIGNRVVGKQVDDGSAGGPGIYVEGTRSRIADNDIRMAPTATNVNVVGIRVRTSNLTSGDHDLPTPVGELAIENNTVYGGYNGVEFGPDSVGPASVRFKNNAVYGADSHGMIFASISGVSYLDITGNYTEGCGGDGIRLSGTWTEARLFDNHARNNTGYGLNIPSGTHTKTWLRDNRGTGNTAGEINLGITATRLGSLLFTGAWSAGTAYAFNDVVTYLGSTYRRQVAGTTATVPSSDATNWELVAAGGSTGTQGPQGATGAQGSQGATGSTVLAQSAVAVPHTGDTVESALATITVPANSMGANGRVRVTALFSMTSSANNKTPRIRFGGAAGTIHHGQAVTTAGIYRCQAEIANRGATNSQVGGPTAATGGWGTHSSSPATGAVDTTASTTIVISGQLANSGETITLESYLVELIP